MIDEPPFYYEIIAALDDETDPSALSKFNPADVARVLEISGTLQKTINTNQAAYEPPKGVDDNLNAIISIIDTGKTGYSATALADAIDTTKRRYNLEQFQGDYFDIYNAPVTGPTVKSSSAYQRRPVIDDRIPPAKTMNKVKADDNASTNTSSSRTSNCSIM